MNEYVRLPVGFRQVIYPSRALRVFREILQASGDLHDDSAHFDNDEYNRQNNS